MTKEKEMKKMKKALALTLATVVAVGMMSIVSSAGEDTAVVYDGPEMTLTVNFASAEYNNAYMVAAFDRITERTDGKVQFDVSYSSGILSLAEALDGLANGVVDISDITLSNYPETFVYTTQMCAYPFIGFQDILSANDIVRDVIVNNRNDLMESEFTNAGIRCFFTSAIYGSCFICKDDITIKKPEDLKGLKVMTQDLILSPFITSEGGSPVAQPVIEMFSALNNGVVDCAFNGANVAQAFGAIDIAKSIWKFETDLSTHIKTCCINLDVWNSFTPELQQIWDEEMGDGLYADFKEFVASQEETMWGEFDASETLIVDMITNEDIEAWKEAITPFADARMEELRASSPDVDAAKAIWDEAIATYYGEK